MRFFRNVFFVLTASLFFSSNISAQESRQKGGGRDTDTIRVYRLGSVIDVRSDIERSSIPSAPINIDYHDLHSVDAVSLNEISALMPAAFFQTNSRGESLLYMRGSGDRRTEIFWDGMLLNLPWDRRYDLQSVPTYLIGNIAVSNGSASILYGSNTMGGAVDIATTERNEEGFGGSVRLMAGDGNMYDFALTQEGRTGKFNYVANMGYYSRDGFLLDAESADAAKAGNPEMISQNPGSALRTNTDEKRLNMYLRTEYAFTEKSSGGLSFMHISGEQGVAPESNEPDPRSWRYPDYSRTVGSLNFASEITENQKLKAVAWIDFFNQDIDNYTDMTYSTRNERTNDDITTLGTRLSYDFSPSYNHSWTASASSYYTMCTETVSPIENEVVSDGTAADYSEILYDLGIEYRYQPVRDLILSAGGLFSGRQNPETGFYSESEGASSNDFGGILGAKYFISDNLTTFANVSRKVSYPSLRQTYANDPAKFKPNPGLTPEHGILSELGIKYRQYDWSIQAAGFFNSYSDMIAKARLQDDPQGRKYIRVNLSEGYIAGLETVLGFYKIKNLDIDASAVYMYGRGKSEPNAEQTYLDYVPEIMVNFRGEYKFPYDIKFASEIEYTGTRYDADEKLDPALTLNAKISYMLPIDFAFAELFIRCNNITDTQKFQKLGLPAPGRTIMTGLKTHF